MISIKASLDRYTEMRQLATSWVQALLYTLESVAQYAVETEPEAVSQFQSDLSAIGDRLRLAADHPEQTEIATLRSDIRATLRDYRDWAAAFIGRLRQDMNATAEALSSLLMNIQGEGGSAEGSLQNEISHLHTLTSLTSLGAMREGINRSTVRLVECVSQLRKEKESIIVQLRDEINVLHQAVDEARRASTLDSLTGVSSRDELVRFLRRALESRTSVAVVHIWLQNLPKLAKIHEKAVCNALLSAFSKRMKSAVPPDAISGRWADDVFCVLVPSGSVRVVSESIAQSCIGCYTWIANGRTRSLALQGV